ncbi:MAG: methyltransferase [Rikenellaceae bacterium]|nr:methyltransferase [Rikenellaceae bacterium]
MPNDYFRFKQFTVRQAGVPMKVGTDGVLLGAWAAFDGTERHILDIGTGTGLIALMAAQRTASDDPRRPEALVDAVEIDAASSRMAALNAASSPWAPRIRVHHSPLQTYAPECATRYDHILTNPPYFTESLTPPDAGRALARHADALPFDELARHSAALLAPGGRLSLILPPDAVAAFTLRALAHGLRCARKTDVFPTPTGRIKRTLAEFMFHPPRYDADFLIIADEGRRGYSEEYRELTRDFYLKF